MTSLKEETNGDRNNPAEFELLGNYPNPFNLSTTIRIRLNTEYFGQIEVRIYNMLGQLVQILHAQVNGKGIYNIVWNGLGRNGLALSSGVYFYGIELQSTVFVGKMNLLK